jgi:hypothetical protein
VTQDLISIEPWRQEAQAEQRIFNAWYASLISGIGTLLLTALASRAGPADDPARIAVSIDGLITIALGWITQRYNSRVAAALLTLRSFGFGSFLLFDGAILAALLTLLVFTPVYYVGFRGTRDLYRLRSARTEEPRSA